MIDHDASAPLATRLAALHRTPAPPDLPPIEGTPQLLRLGTTDPTAPLREALGAEIDIWNPFTENGITSYPRGVKGVESMFAPALGAAPDGSAS